MKDSAQDYYNFSHPHAGIAAGYLSHRLGRFRAFAALRPRQAWPLVAIVHVPVYDIGTPKNDFTAERVADYLSSPENGTRFASVHASADRDSNVLCLPADVACRGCGNWNTAEDSWEIEIAGLSTEPGSYWAGPDGTAKLKQAARAHVKATKLAFGDQWRTCIVPPQMGTLDATGRVTRPGWLQHRDVPYWDEIFDANGRATGISRVLPKPGWAQPPEQNILAGQHSDICADFPWEYFFKLLAEEINNGANT